MELVTESKKIVLVSSGQPSANPRLVKEAIALNSWGYTVTVIYCPLSPWADAYDKALFLSNNNIKWIKVGYHYNNYKWMYRYARFRKKYWSYVYKIKGNKWDAAIRSEVLFSQELNKEVKKHYADLYIGHNLGALPSIVKAAKKNATKAVFDFEDFHRGEVKEHSEVWLKTLETENKYVPFLDSATAASPLINLNYKNLYPSISITTINNCFPLQYAQTETKDLPPEPLKMFWFSQTIGKNRGLEIVIKAMGKVKNIELTLLGNCSPTIKDYFVSCAQLHNINTQKIHFLSAVPVSEIPTISSKYHIGLSTEIPTTVNRDICLTNKIFMYMLAGNAIIFSNTKAHSLLLKQHTDIGKVFKWDDADELADVLNSYINNTDLLTTHRRNSLHLSKTVLNWDTEKNIFLDYINDIVI